MFLVNTKTTPILRLETKKLCDFMAAHAAESAFLGKQEDTQQSMFLTRYLLMRAEVGNSV